MENDLEKDPIDFELYSEDCSSTDATNRPVVQYDMYGASPWETVPDVLQMYGMCSYSNWYEYLEFVDPTSPLRANQGLCGGRALEKKCVSPMASDATVSRWWDLRRPHAEPSMRSLWETQKFRVDAHVCDRY